MFIGEKNLMKLNHHWNYTKPIQYIAQYIVVVKLSAGIEPALRKRCLTKTVHSQCAKIAKYGKVIE